ncbi:MAG: DUF2806 domain-containing protein [Candidatus Paceibacterota bacterium]
MSIVNLPQPIKDLGKATLSKVADKFIDFVITKYTGKSIKVFEAEGDIEADKIKTSWEVLEKPFWLQAEATKMNRQYSNLGNTLMKSTSLIITAENKIKDDNDVFWVFLEHSKEISNEQMQGLIAKIIAGEYNTPSAYSMSTLQIIKMLGKNELELFENICSLLLNNEWIPIELFVLGDNVKELMNKINIDFESLQTLQSLGLFLSNEMTKSIENLEKKDYIIQYYDKQLVFNSENNNFKKIILPESYVLSTVGKQILKHLNPKYIEDYFTWLKLNYKVPNYKLLNNTSKI